MTVHSPLLKDVPVGKGRYSYQTHASLVGMVYIKKLAYLPTVKKKKNSAGGELEGVAVVFKSQCPLTRPRNAAEVSEPASPRGPSVETDRPA